MSPGKRPEPGYAKQRSFAALYVVNAALRVLFHAPGDQVSAVPAYDDEEALPRQLRDTVLSIMETFTDGRRVGVEISSDGSTLVRVACEAEPGTRMAVFVHEYKTRDGVTQFVADHAITPREHEVLLMLIDGYTTVTTAGYLNIAVSTVLLHIKSLFMKTRSHSRTELVGKVVLYDGRISNAPPRPPGKER